MLEQTLRQYFGFDSLRHGQQEVIEHILAGGSAAAIFPTGSGKSLCYQLPALLLPHLTLVISPLLALMHDQLEFLQSRGIAAACIDSSQDREQVQHVMHQARSGTLKVLMISVERLKNERFRQFISQVPISLLVVDEAHCISEWGHNFRPDYLKLPHYRKLLNIPQVLLLTATATPQVISDMQTKFAIDQANVTVTGFYRSNLYLRVLPCSESEKLGQLQQLIGPRPDLPTIVYVTLQKTAEAVASELQRAGIAAQPYHAGLASERREAIQQQFMQGQVSCIVATIAFGMGIDKSDIRRVVHYDLPKSIENYSQEIGRAGRDGERSECITLANTENLNVLENFVYGDTPERSAIAAVVSDIYACEGDWEVVMYQLSQQSNIRQLPLKTLLVYLELKQVITAKYSYFATYRFKLNESIDVIIARFQGERQAFVAAIFQCAAKARTWYSLDFDALWMMYRAERKRVVAALDYFHEQGWIELESKQITDVYQVLERTKPQSVLVDELYELFARKEHSEIQRIQTMLNFFQSSDCLSYTLAHYFADDKAPHACHHCSVCEGHVATLSGRQLPALEPAMLSTWIEPLIAANGGAPLSVATLSRFLCGITCPLTTRLKASRMEGYGKLEHYPFAQVQRELEQLLSFSRPH